MPKAWSCIALGDERQYGGNAGYDDELSSKYSFDSNVANHKQLSGGDLIVLRDNRRVLGMARVAEVTTRLGTKLLRRCPNCQTTSLKKRVRKTPSWRCSSGHEFDDPSEREERVTKYEAYFADSFIRLDREISTTQLKSAALRPSDQLSIEELDLARLERLLSPTGGEALDMAITASFVDTAMPDEIEEHSIEEDGDSENSVPSMADDRKKILRAIRVRRGQAGFRRDLIKRYGARCLVTGCEVEDLLEAAHIAPYRNSSHHDPRNGLLLRADIHTLFDLHLLKIDPSSLAITFDESVCREGYSAYHGKPLCVGSKRPSEKYLKVRANLLSANARPS